MSKLPDTVAGASPAASIGLPPKLTGARGVMMRPWCSPFHRILWLTMLANVLVAAWLVLALASWDSMLGAVLTAATVNIAVAGCVRQQYVVNALFAAALAVPHRWPLRLRAAVAQVYQVPGAVHVGCSSSAIAWFTGYTTLVIVRPPTTSGPGQRVGLYAVIGAILTVLIIMAVCARPSMRERQHDLFEATHRYGGWAALLLFVALTFLHAAASPGSALPTIYGSATTWILVGLLAITALPWLQLRRLPVTVQTPSDHVAIVTIAHGSPLPGSATRLARHPLGQWHSFATMTVPGRDGFRFAISRAGGWTGQFITDRPDTVWTKGVPTAGMVSVCRAFTRVVWLATGSGIAPCLPQLLARRTAATLMWVTRDPVRTYGQGLVDEIQDASPGAIFWNSDERGKPDLVELAYRTYRDTGAEAILVISNKATTLAIINELRSRGVPALAPIFDS